MFQLLALIGLFILPAGADDVSPGETLSQPVSSVCSIFEAPIGRGKTQFRIDDNEVAHALRAIDRLSDADVEIAYQRLNKRAGEQPITVGYSGGVFLTDVLNSEH